MVDEVTIRIGELVCLFKAKMFKMCAQQVWREVDRFSISSSAYLLLLQSRRMSSRNKRVDFFQVWEGQDIHVRRQHLDRHQPLHGHQGTLRTKNNQVIHGKVSFQIDINGSLLDKLKLFLWRKQTTMKA